MGLRRYDEDVQDRILRLLVDIYPDITPQHEVQKSIGGDEDIFEFNLFYLFDHKMIWWLDMDLEDGKTERRVRATASGVDRLRAKASQ